LLYPACFVAKNKNQYQSSVLELNNLSIHPGRHEVLVDGKPIDLTFTEFRLLHLLASRPGWVFTRYQIVDAIKGEDYIVTDRTVDVQVVGLRKKLGDYGRYIETVAYRLSVQRFIVKETSCLAAVSLSGDNFIFLIAILYFINIWKVLHRAKRMHLRKNLSVQPNRDRFGLNNASGDSLCKN
jgi:DNA-binding winged helix-turn-helix (wHTH) protein